MNRQPRGSVRSTDRDKGDICTGEAPPSSPSSIGRKRHFRYESDDDDRRILMEDMTRRRESDENRLKLEEKRFELYKVLDECEMKEVEEKLDIQKHRLDLDDKKGTAQIE